MTPVKSRFEPLFQAILSLFILSSCQWSPLPGDPPSLPAPPVENQNPAPPAQPPSLPESLSCESPDPEFQCLALKIVSYENPEAPTVLQKLEADLLVEQINAVWKPCKIGFQLEQYQSINPLTLGLEYNPEWRSQASQVRATFSDNQTLLIVATGKLTSSTIAVTQMPGVAPFGVLVEDSFAKNSLTVGHELGHYMGLYHFRNTTNLMNPYIGDSTKNLTSNQCGIARSTNQREWTQMMR